MGRDFSSTLNLSPSTSFYSILYLHPQIRTNLQCRTYFRKEGKWFHYVGIPSRSVILSALLLFSTSIKGVSLSVTILKTEYINVKTKGKHVHL